MDLYLETEIPCPYEPLAEVLQSGPERWLPQAERTGEALIFEVGVGSGRRGVRRRVKVTLSRVTPFGYGVAVRIAWRAARRPELYPTLEGALRLERTDRADRSRLRFDASYQPPAGRLGVALDQALMHRVAEASLRDFVARLVEGLQEAVELPDEGPVVGGRTDVDAGQALPPMER
jgi:hypothetical protein